MVGERFFKRISLDEDYIFFDKKQEYINKKNDIPCRILENQEWNEYFPMSDEQVVNLLNKFIIEKEIIKNKLLNEILDYDKISHDNWMMGLTESVESIKSEVEDLFNNPKSFQLRKESDDCAYWHHGVCSKFNKEIEEFTLCDCKEFKWK